MMEMLLVVLLISLIAGLSFPSVTTGLDSIRMRSAADSAAAFLSAAATQVERREEPLELVFSKTQNSLEAHGLLGKYNRAIILPDGIRLAGVLPEPPGEPQATRSIVVFPGATVPQITLVLENSRGARRTVQLDPVTGVARVNAPPAS